MTAVPDELRELYDETVKQSIVIGVPIGDIDDVALGAVLDRHEQMVRAKATEMIRTYRCGATEVCGECVCRADLIKLLRGDR